MTALHIAGWVAVAFFCTVGVRRCAVWLLWRYGPSNIHIRLFPWRRPSRARLAKMADAARGMGAPTVAEYVATCRYDMHGQRMTHPLDRDPEQTQIDSAALKARGVLPGLHTGGNNAPPVCPNCGALLPHLKENR